MEIVFFLVLYEFKLIFLFVLQCFSQNVNYMPMGPGLKIKSLYTKVGVMGWWKFFLVLHEFKLIFYLF